MSEKRSISYPEIVDEIINDLIDAGLVENRSEFFQKAAQTHLSFMAEQTYLFSDTVDDMDSYDDVDEWLEHVADTLELRGDI